MDRLWAILLSRKALEKTRSALEEAYQLCRKHGIRFIVAFAPTKYRVYQGLPNLTEVSTEVSEWVVNDLPERLGAIVSEISPDISYVDVTPLLKSAISGGTQIFLPDDIHWSPEGQRIFAQATHKVLTSPIVAAH